MINNFIYGISEGSTIVFSMISERVMLRSEAWMHIGSGSFRMQEPAGNSKGM